MSAPAPVYYSDEIVSYSDNPTVFKGIPPAGGMRSRIGIGIAYRGKTISAIEKRDNKLIIPADTARHLLTDPYLGRPLRQDSKELNLVLPPGTRGRPSGFYSFVNAATIFKRLTVNGSQHDDPFIHGLRMNGDIQLGANPRYMTPTDVAREFNVANKVVQAGLAKAAAGFTELVIQTKNPDVSIKGNKSIMFNLPNPFDTTKSKTFPVFVIPAHLNEYIPTVMNLCEKTVIKNLKLGSARNGTENNLSKMMNYAEFSKDDRLLNSLMSYDVNMMSNVPRSAYAYLPTVQPPEGGASPVPFAVPHAPHVPTLSENRQVPIIPSVVVKRANDGGTPSGKRPRSSSSSNAASSSNDIFSGETAFQRTTTDDATAFRPVLSDSDSDSE